MAKHKKSDEQIIRSSKNLVNNFERLIKTISSDIDETINPLNEKLSELRSRINEYETAVQVVQKIHRLSIAVFQLFDVTDVDEIWSRGLISRERYAALSWEFHTIYNLTFYKQLKWRNKDQYREAMMEIMDEYRESTNPYYEKGSEIMANKEQKKSKKDKKKPPAKKDKKKTQEKK